MPTGLAIGDLGRELGQPIGVVTANLHPDRMLLADLMSESGLNVRSYATMDSVEKTTEGGNSLLVDGMSPLDVLVLRLDMSIKDFCDYIGVEDRSFRRWRKTGVVTLSHKQAKRLDTLLRRVGLTIQDLPDDLMKYSAKNAQVSEA